MKKCYYTLAFILLICVGNVSAQLTVASWPLQGTTAGTGISGITVHPVTLGSGVSFASWINSPSVWCNGSTGCSGMQTNNWASSNTSLTASTSSGSYAGGAINNNHYVEFSFTSGAGMPVMYISSFNFEASAGFTSNCTGQDAFSVHWTRNSTTINGSSLISQNTPSPCTWETGWINGSNDGACAQYTIDNGSACGSPFPITVNPGDRIRFRVYIGSTRDNNSWRVLFGSASMEVMTFLSVSLNDFNANCENNETVLNWSTSSEENSSHFEVERSEDAQVWKTVATVPASGNSNSIKYYTAKDINRFTDVGYYRLREVDNDGVSQVHKSIAVNCTSNENNLVVYPNPSNGDFSVEVNSDEPLQEAAVVVYDISGKQVQRREINHSMVGSNMISFSNTKMEKGAYLIVIESKNKNNFKPEKLVIN